MEIEIEKSWKEKLGSEFKKEYFLNILNFLNSEIKLGKIIYPEQSKIFEAFDLTSFEKIKVVILGQDPYHGENQADGLSFSIKKNCNLPPSLKNIFKEISNEFNCSMPINGNLTNWANQGVLLLNTHLTVEAHLPFSHATIGWATFTDKVIEIISDQKENIVFLLWGKQAQKKQQLIDITKHKILCTSHPSPFSAHKGFLGCNHFKAANQWLIAHQLSAIQWCNEN